MKKVTLVAMTALLVGLGATPAWAPRDCGSCITARDLGRNSVGPSELRPHAVRTRHLKPGTAMLPGDVLLRSGALGGPDTIPDDAAPRGIGEAGIIIIGGKSSVLALGHVTATDIAGPRSGPATLRLRLLLDGAPVGVAVPHLVPDGFTQTVPFTLFVPGVPPGAHTLTLQAEVSGSDGLTVDGGTLGLLALQEVS